MKLPCKYSIQENENNSLKIEDDEIKYTNNEGEDIGLIGEREILRKN